MVDLEKALRNKERFESSKGALNLEQLYDVPLRSKDGFDLDAIARVIYNKIKDSEEVSFVNSSSSDNKLQNKLDIVKHIIDLKLKEEDDRKQAKEKLEKKRKLAELIAQKKDQQLSEKSIEELEKEFASI